MYLRCLGSPVHPAGCATGGSRRCTLKIRFVKIKPVSSLAKLTSVKCSRPRLGIAEAEVER